MFGRGPIRALRGKEGIRGIKNGVGRVERAKQPDLESWRKVFEGWRNWRKGSRGRKRGGKEERRA